MKNKMADVRNHLVEMMEALNDKEVEPATVERAKALADLAQTYTNTVKVEIDARRLAEMSDLPDVLQPAQLRLVGEKRTA